MKINCIFIVLFLFLLTFANDNYYLFTREWPPTSCLTGKCNYLENWNGSVLNIHGLWLQNGPAEKCSHPQQCLNIPFDANSLSSQTKNDLTYHWVGVFNDPTSFHTHQWQKHGTCYQKQQTNPTGRLRILQQINSDQYQEKYFRQAITMNQQHAAIQLLKNKGIVPSKSTGYSLSNMLIALGTTTLNSLLTCKNMNGIYYWNSYYVCYNKSFQIVNCPCQVSASSGEVSCPAGTPIYIPTI